MAELLMDRWLARTAHLPFDWSCAGRVGPGVTCVSWVAGYVAAATGRDVLAGLDAVVGRRAALMELHRRGGIDAAFAAALGAPAAAPVEIGVALVRVGKRSVAALRRAGRSLLKTDGGVVIGPPPYLSWEV